MSGKDMAQALLQMPSMRHDIKYEELQRIRQTSLLWRARP